MRPELPAVARARRSLNAIAILGGGLAWLAPAAALAGLAALALGFAGLLPAARPVLPLWGGLSGAAFTLGLALSARRRLDDGAAAAWLDARLGSKELLSAALARDKPGRLPGRFDAEIGLRAAALAGKALRPGYPWRFLAIRAAASLASVLLFGALLSVAANASYRLVPPGGKLAPDVARALPALSRGGLALSDPASTAMASYLFAEDPGLADSAGKALREGRVSDLRNLLAKAARDLDDRLSRAVSDSERKRLLQERRKLDAASAALSGEGGEGGGASPAADPFAEDGSSDLEGGLPGSGGGPPQFRGGPGQAPRRGDGDGGGEGGKGKAPPQGNSGPQDGPGGQGGHGGGAPPGTQPPGSPGQAPGQGGGQGGGDGPTPGSPQPPSQGGGSGGAGGPGAGEGAGSSAGSGSGSAKAWGKVRPSAKGGTMSVAADPTTPFFDYVLKGRDAGAVLPGLAASAAKASESAIAGYDLPFEYDDFVRAYFLALAKEAAAGAGTAPAAPGK
jgi:hypothetical protein